MKALQICILCLALATAPSVAVAHSGGTNADGCHTESATGDYHCHGGGSSDATSIFGILLVAGVLVGLVAWIWSSAGKSKPPKASASQLKHPIGLQLAQDRELAYCLEGDAEVVVDVLVVRGGVAQFKGFDHPGSESDHNLKCIESAVDGMQTSLRPNLPKYYHIPLELKHSKRKPPEPPQRESQEGVEDTDYR